MILQFLTTGVLCLFVLTNAVERDDGSRLEMGDSDPMRDPDGFDRIEGDFFGEETTATDGVAIDRAFTDAAMTKYADAFGTDESFLGLIADPVVTQEHKHVTIAGQEVPTDRDFKLSTWNDETKKKLMDPDTARTAVLATMNNVTTMGSAVDAQHVDQKAAATIGMIEGMVAQKADFELDATEGQKAALNKVQTRLTELKTTFMPEIHETTGTAPEAPELTGEEKVKEWQYAVEKLFYEDGMAQLIERAALGTRDQQRERALDQDLDKLGDFRTSKVIVQKYVPDVTKLTDVSTVQDLQKHATLVSQFVSGVDERMPEFDATTKESAAQIADMKKQVQTFMQQTNAAAGSTGATQAPTEELKAEWKTLTDNLNQKGWSTVVDLVGKAKTTTDQLNEKFDHVQPEEIEEFDTARELLKDFASESNIDRLGSVGNKQELESKLAAVEKLVQGVEARRPELEANAQLNDAQKGAIAETVTTEIKSKLNGVRTRLQSSPDAVLATDGAELQQEWKTLVTEKRTELMNMLTATGVQTSTGRAQAHTRMMNKTDFDDFQKSRKFFAEFGGDANVLAAGDSLEDVEKRVTAGLSFIRGMRDRKTELEGQATDEQKDVLNNKLAQCQTELEATRSRLGQAKKDARTEAVTTRGKPTSTTDATRQFIQKEWTPKAKELTDNCFGRLQGLANQETLFKGARDQTQQFLAKKPMRQVNNFTLVKDFARSLQRKEDGTGFKDLRYADSDEDLFKRTSLLRKAFEGLEARMPELKQRASTQQQQALDKMQTWKQDMTNLQTRAREAVVNGNRDVPPSDHEETVRGLKSEFETKVAQFEADGLDDLLDKSLLDIETTVDRGSKQLSGLSMSQLNEYRSSNQFMSQFGRDPTHLKAANDDLELTKKIKATESMYRGLLDRKPMLEKDEKVTQVQRDALNRVGEMHQKIKNVEEKIRRDRRVTPDTQAEWDKLTNEMKNTGHQHLVDVGSTVKTPIDVFEQTVSGFTAEQLKDPMKAAEMLKPLQDLSMLPKLDSKETMDKVLLASQAVKQAPDQTKLGLPKNFVDAYSRLGSEGQQMRTTLRRHGPSVQRVKEHMQITVNFNQYTQPSETVVHQPKPTGGSEPVAPKPEPKPNTAGSDPAPAKETAPAEEKKAPPPDNGVAAYSGSVLMMSMSVLLVVRA